MRTALTFVLALAAFGCAESKAPPCSSATGRTIAVRVIGIQRLRPDGVSFSVGVETRGSSVVDAFGANDRKVQAVLAALKKQGVLSEELQTSEVDVWPVTSNSGRVAGFRVSNQVTVRRRGIAAAPALLQAAVAAGANQLGGLHFFVADPQAFQREGLDLALQDARKKAEAVAGLSSRPLGSMLCVTEETSPSGSEGYARLAGLGYIEPTIQPGQQERTTAVTAVFELK